MTTVIEIPLTGLMRAQGRDYGAGTVVQGAKNTGANEWRPAGSLVDGTQYGLSTYTQNLPGGTFQSPDVCYFESRKENYALTFEKLYVPASDVNTVKSISTIEDFYSGVYGSARSWQTPLETTTIRCCDFPSANNPITYSKYLDCFVSYVYQVYISDIGSSEVFWKLIFFDKNTGKKLNEQSCFFPTQQYAGYLKSHDPIDTKQFISETPDGKIGIIGFTTSGDNPNRVIEYVQQVTKVVLPDKQVRFSCDPLVTEQTFLATADGQCLGYASVTSSDGVSEIDIIAVVTNISGVPGISLTSRINRTLVSQLVVSPSTSTGSPTFEGSLLISDYSNDVVLSWAYVQTSGATPSTGVSYQLLTINKTSGALSLSGSQVNLRNELVSTGSYINAFATYDTNVAPSLFYPCFFANKKLTNGNIATYQKSQNPSTVQPSLSANSKLFGFFFNSQPIKIKNFFICIGSWYTGTGDLEFGQSYLSIYNYTNDVFLYQYSGLIPKVTGVMGYNTTFGRSYSQIGYCPFSSVLMSITSDDDSLYSRSTQVGYCESIRPVKFNGETYLFSGFQYLVTPSIGLGRIGTYTTPVISGIEYGIGSVSGTYTFTACFQSNGGDGPTCNPFNVVLTSALGFTFTFWSNPFDFSTLDTIYPDLTIYVIDPLDSLYKAMTNPIVVGSISSSTSAGTISFSVDISSGIQYGNIAQFETGEAPQVGLNSPKLAGLALSRVVCSDEFSEKIYTSKQPNESRLCEFSDVLYVNASPATEPITEILELSNSLVAFSYDSIYAISGTLPDAFGTQSLSDWQLISNNTGATTASATIISDSGAYFASPDGIQLLTRGFQVQDISSPRVLSTYESPSLTQDFWWKSSKQDGTNNIMLSTSSLRTRLTESDMEDYFNWLDSVFLVEESNGNMSVLRQRNGNYKNTNLSGILGGVISTTQSTEYLVPFTEENEATALECIYDTGFFCPFGPYGYGQVHSVYVKFFKTGAYTPDYQESGLKPSVALFVRDDETTFEIHESEQMVEDPSPQDNSKVFVWRARISTRRVNAIRVIVDCGYWGLSSIALEVTPQNISGGVKRRLQTVST